MDDDDLPDFLGVGAQKCGTTWLHVQLVRHPELWLPRWKEIHYFDQKMYLRWPLAAYMLKSDAHRWRERLAKDLKANWGDRDWQGFRGSLRQHLGRPSPDWYRRNFVEGRGRVKGEITPAYATLTLEQVHRVKELVPAAKIIFLMRSPIERDWSASLMLTQRDSGTPAQAVEADVRRIVSRDRVAARSDMHSGFNRWADQYPSEQVYLGFLEDVHFHPEQILNSIYRFLGVSEVEVPPEAKDKVHSRSGRTIPLSAARFLAERNLAQLEKLANQFGGYTVLWLEVARWLIDQQGDEAIPYPLWNLPVWQESARQHRIEAGSWFQSRSLAPSPTL